MGPRLHAKAPSAHQFLDVPLANTQFYSLFSVPSRLTANNKPSHQSTRAQLQRQRLQEQHASGFDIDSSSTAVLVNKAIPGLKTSAAFFGSLRTNLSLHASPPLASPLLTPSSLRAISGPYFPPLSPLATPSDLTAIMDPIAATSPPTDDPNSAPAPAAAEAEHDPLAGVPELHTYHATEPGDRTDALKLVADGIAQQRQAANVALIFHPLNLAIAGGVLAIMARVLRDMGYDWSLVGITGGGVLMSLMMICRFMTQDYLFAAEKINFGWLGDDAEVLVTKFGSEIIGTVVLDWVPEGSGSSKRKRNWRGNIRAWTVRMRYRGKGVGTALLEEVVKEAKEKGSVGVWFDEEHAHSKRVLPSIYNGAFNKRERKAEALLQELIDSTSTGKGRRK